jgi:hypothetical protein
MRKIVIALFAGIWIAASALAQDKSTDLAIVVNPACSLDNVSAADLTAIFKAQKAKNPNGVKYAIAVREPGSPERTAALKSIYNMTDADYEKFFLQLTFAGTIPAAPQALTSGAAVCQYVGATPGAISFVRASEATPAVKVVKVDGKSPGDAGYPIKIQ